MSIPLSQWNLLVELKNWDDSAISHLEVDEVDVVMKVMSSNSLILALEDCDRRSLRHEPININKVVVVADNKGVGGLQLEVLEVNGVQFALITAQASQFQ
jgi:hypothetical protein